MVRHALEMTPRACESRSYILHPHGQSFGPFPSAFVHQKLIEGAVTLNTGLTVLIGGKEVEYTDVGALIPEGGRVL